MDENILAKGCQLPKDLCPLDNIKQLLGAATGGTNLETIWVNVDTNDSDVQNGETSDIISAYVENVRLIQEKFPMASIYISTIIPKWKIHE